ncbi:MAG: DUF92 domain-containing protein [Calditrichia bacterium]
MNFSHVFQTPPLEDWLNLGMLFLGMLVFILISEFVRHRFHWRQEVTRKIVHISVGVLLLFTPLLLKTSLPLLVIAGFFTIFNFIALRKNLLPGIHISRDNLGTVYYAFSFFVLVLLFWDQYKIIIIASMMVMAIGDAAAAIVGHSVAKPHQYTLIHDKKSLEGSAAMFLVSMTAIFITFLVYPSAPPVSDQTTLGLFLFSVYAAVIATFSEALGNKGNDNLMVPLLTAIIIYFLLTGSAVAHIQFLTGLLLGGAAAYLSFRANFLSGSGAVATFLLATVIFGFGGLPWTVPILTFFILSSLLSKSGKTVKARYDLIFEKGSRRDYAQVFANGGVAGLLMIAYVLFPDPVFYLLYLGSLAAAMADTWATEIGVLIGQQPRLIYNLKPVPSGTSGGITFAGLFGGLLGAFILSLSGSFFLPNPEIASVYIALAVISLGGLLGSLVDSLLGATLQVQYVCSVCGKVTEKRVHCNGTQTSSVKGLSWMNNDTVNLANTVSGFIFVYLGLKLISGYF